MAYFGKLAKTRFMTDLINATSCIAYRPISSDDETKQFVFKYVTSDITAQFDANSKYKNENISSSENDDPLVPNYDFVSDNVVENPSENIDMSQMSKYRFLKLVYLICGTVAQQLPQKQENPFKSTSDDGYPDLTSIGEEMKSSDCKIKLEDATLTSGTNSRPQIQRTSTSRDERLGILNLSMQFTDVVNAKKVITPSAMPEEITKLKDYVYGEGTVR